MSRRRRLVRVEELLGRAVRTDAGRVIGRIEEIRVERRADRYEVTEMLLGTGAMFERLGLVRRFFGRKPVTLIATWRQIDVSRPESPRLLCNPAELKHG